MFSEIQSLNELRLKLDDISNLGSIQSFMSETNNKVCFY